MSLSLYKKKRHFSQTPEPSGKEKPSKDALRFVIQKHDASHLHYDFRLEMKGVLKSWAVPKGPSLNPADKRLAMLVEDHPYDYRNFEGVIPAGNYGGGTVIVWDEGTYEPIDSDGMSKADQEKNLLKSFFAGSLKFSLDGKKVKGIFSLRKLHKEGDEKAWLLIKSNDEFAEETDVTKKDKSVKTGKTIAQVARENGTEPNHPEEEANIPKSPVKLLPKKVAAPKKETEKKVPKGTTIKKVIRKTATQKAAKKAASEKAPKKAVADPSSKIISKKGELKTKTSGHQLTLDDGKDQLVTVDKYDLQLTNLDKLYWKKEGGRKIDSINYYFKITPYILPYMLQRPQSLNRHPNGIDAPNFFQKNMKGKVPDWMKTHTDFSESTNEDIEYLVCANEASLIYMANLGCIEMNPWHSRSASWQKPDWCVIDLDPDKTNSFDQVIETAKVVKKILDSIGADSCVKTSGSSGIHIYIPLGAKYNYEQSKQLAELVVTMVNIELPKLTSVERNPAKRKGKIYLDFLQNRETQTAAAPYSLRPKPGMPVSTPLHWSELKKGLTPTTYTMSNIFDRLKVEGDLFQPVLGKGIDLQKVLRTLEATATYK